MGGARCAICVIVFSLAVVSVKAKGNTLEDDSCFLGNRDLDWFSYGFYQSSQKVNDTFVGLAEAIPIKNIRDLETGDSPYLSFLLDKKANIIIVSTTSDFFNYEKTEIGNEIKTPMIITCENGKVYNLTYIQPINDINTYAPVFAESDYEFTIYGNLPDEFELSNFINTSASDLDCSPDDLTFSIRNVDGSDTDDLEIDTCRREGKTKWACIYAYRDITAPYDGTYTLKVKDRSYSDDNKETTATLKLKLKVLENEMDLAFDKASYSLSVVKDRLVNDEIIQMTNGIDEDVKVVIEKSEYSKYFSVRKDYYTNSIQLSLENNLPDPPETYSVDAKQDFQLTLNVTWQNKQAITEVKVHSDKDLEVVCHVPDIDIERSYFKNPNRVNDMFVGNVFTMSKIANVKSMKCEGSKFLECKFESGVFTVSTTQQFAQYEENEMEDTLRTNLTIECPYSSKTLEFQQEIEDINNHDPVFDKSAYTFAFYNEVPESYEVTLLSEISVTDLDLTPYSCKFQFDKGQSKSDIFEIGYDTNTFNKTCRPRLSLKETISAPFQATLTLFVSDNEKRTTETKIHVKVDKDESTPFRFTSNEFYVKMGKVHKTMVRYEDYETPNLENGFDSNTQLFIDDKGYAGMMDMKINTLTGKLDIVLRKHAQFPDKEYVRLPIRATWKGLETTAYLIIILSEDYHPSSTTSTTTSMTSSHSPSMETTKVPGHEKYPEEELGQLSGINMFILLSTIGIITIFVMSAIVLAGVIFMIG